MDLRESIFLGAVQGLTEFLPISSSGHLVLAKHVLGVKIQNPLGFDIVMHIGTTLAVIFFMWRRIIEMLKTTQRAKSLSALSIAFFSTIPVALFLERYAEVVEVEIKLLSITFLIGALIILIASRISLSTKSFFLTYFIIGIFQGISALPGISRSGSTISACLLFGMSPAHAFDFSFMLSVPTILAAVAYELLFVIVGRETLGDIGFANLLAGVLSSFLIGLISLYVLRRFVISGKFWIFGLYNLFISFLVWKVL